MEEIKSAHHRNSRLLIMRLPRLQKVIFARTEDDRYLKMVRSTEVPQEVCLQPLTEH